MLHLEEKALTDYHCAENFQNCIEKASQEVVVWPYKVLVGRFKTLVGEIDPEKFLDANYMRSKMSQISDPIIEREFLIAPNAGPYSHKGHFLIFYNGVKEDCQHLLRLDQDEQQTLVDLALRASNSLFANDRDINEIAWLINRGDPVKDIKRGDPVKDIKNRIKNQSIPRFHLQVVVPDILSWKMERVDPFREHSGASEILDAIGFSELTFLLNAELRRRLKERLKGTFFRLDVARYVQVEPAINHEPTINHRLDERTNRLLIHFLLQVISEECESLLDTLKKAGVYYGYSIAVKIGREERLQCVRVGFYRQYAATLIGPLVFRTPAKGQEIDELQFLIRSNFEKFRQSWISNPRGN